MDNRIPISIQKPYIVYIYIYISEMYIFLIIIITYMFYLLFCIDDFNFNDSINSVFFLNYL